MFLHACRHDKPLDFLRRHLFGMAAHYEMDLVRPLFQSTGPAGPKVLWVRSTGSHIAFCERQDEPPPSKSGRNVITVVKVVDGKVVAKWQFG